MWDESNFFANFVVLYRYMPLHAFEATLDNWALKATMSYEANDPLEMTPQDEIDTKGLPIGYYTNQPEYNAPPFICFSRVISSSAMWGHYADSGHGVCLVFLMPLGKEAESWSNAENHSKLIKGEKETEGEYVFELGIPEDSVDEQTSASVKHSYIAPVRYEKERVPGLKRFLNGYDTDTQMLHKRLKKWSHDLMTTKAKSWKYEEEVRMVCDPRYADEIKETKVLYSWPMRFLVGVVAGPRCVYTRDMLRKKMEFAYAKVKESKGNYIFNAAKDIFNDSFVVSRAKLHATDYKIVAEPWFDRLKGEHVKKNVHSYMKRFHNHSTDK